MKYAVINRDSREVLVQGHEAVSARHATCTIGGNRLSHVACPQRENKFLVILPNDEVIKVLGSLLAFGNPTTSLQTLATSDEGWTGLEVGNAGEASELARFLNFGHSYEWLAKQIDQKD